MDDDEKWHELVPGRVVDVTVKAETGRSSLVARLNGVLAEFGPWRVGRKNGRPAIFRVYWR